ncbi:DUF397 domain-containing protein [Streptomyces sennicomposti]|uniref:DUF397 domain-containing protein n=1 Tax=Streptomyces sennicomposti TaxID=2873384 RepID=UPI001CA7177C|nr:DUF397 domain-containing protein [Streptomyces sennicomposti]MBY8869497.1 DUF397 domain-containing protein [Streptomyces sennicomposti]
MENKAKPTGIQWRKSSYSGDQGGECVECAPLGPLEWRKSSYSGDQGGDCLEVAEAPCATVALRDSKVPSGPVLNVRPGAFSTFVSWASSVG